MSRKSAAKRGKALKRQLQGVRIATQLPVRTLRPSAERKIAKERAPHLWIYPGLENAAYKFGTTHPRTSFLGLPTEIRQQILYMSLNMKDLEVAAADEIATKEETTRKLTAIRKLRTDKLAQLAFHKGEIKFLKAFCRHTTLLCGISPVVRKELRWVRMRFRRELLSYLDDKRSRNDAFTLPMTRSNVIPVAQLNHSDRERQKTIQGKKKKSSEGRNRPRKCWACRERHVDGNPVCPMERRDGVRWFRMTKKVGSRKGEKHVMKCMKVVFED